MSLDCQLGIVAMWGEWEDLYKWLDGVLQGEVLYRCMGAKQCVAGFGIGGKIGKEMSSVITYDSSRGTIDGEERFRNLQMTLAINGGQRFRFNPFDNGSRTFSYGFSNGIDDRLRGSSAPLCQDFKVQILGGGETHRCNLALASFPAKRYLRGWVWGVKTQIGVFYFFATFSQRRVRLFSKEFPKTEKSS
ncbi:hypothetical protein Tco_0112021 [Tanacetum coccineum]